MCAAVGTAQWRTLENGSYWGAQKIQALNVLQSDTRSMR